MKLVNVLNLKQNKAIISICGGGGKTSTLFNLAYDLNDYRVLVTTTTKILKPELSEKYDLIIEKKSSEFIRHINKSNRKNLIIWGSSSPDGTRKLNGCSPADLHLVKDYFDYILIEADGAAGKPLKAPADHEPVISEMTNIYIGVIGLDCIGKPADNNFIHRPEYFSKIRDKSEHEVISPEDLIKLINHPLGLFKDAPKNCTKVVLLNKADLINFNEGKEYVKKLYTEAVFPITIILNSFKYSESVLHSEIPAVLLN
jgi:probable selenium-dependent hydroxylase accessory protein YqeC